MTALSGSRDLCPASPNHRDVNLHLTTDPSPQTPLDTRASLSSPQKQIITPQQPPLAPVHYSHLSASCLNYFTSVNLLCQNVSLSLAVFFCPRFIIWSICGWVTNLRWISEPIYLLTLMHRDTLLPITFLCKAFWQDHLPA